MGHYGTQGSIEAHAQYDGVEIVSNYGLGVTFISFWASEVCFAYNWPFWNELLNFASINHLNMLREV